MITNTDSIIDVQEVIDRVLELEAEQEDLLLHDSGADSQEFQDWEKEEGKELDSLRELLEECRDNGGDVEYLDGWYPAQLIHRDHFQKYAEDLAEDIGAIPKDATWPARHIDWEAAAREFEQDYTSIDFDGETYLCR